MIASMTAHKHEINDDDAIMHAIANAQNHGGAQVDDLDAVSGASLGVEGIIELGREALQAHQH